MDIYLVGGAVRDELLNYPFHERDWLVVGATPEELTDLGYEQVGKDFPVFLHPKTKEEYALARRERKTAAGYHGFVCDFGPEVSVEDDLRRRDLTINAMAKADDGSLIDPFGGQQDLEQRLLRHVSPAFAEDPLRIFRVARFAARYAHLGFHIADDTLLLMRQMSTARELGALSPERIMVEINKALSERQPSAFFESLQACGALNTLSPAWADSLNAALLQALNKTGLDVDQRFALSCSAMSGEDAEALCTRLRASKLATLLARHAASALPLTRALSADATLSQLEALDYLRRPEILDKLCGIAAALGEDGEQLQQLKRAAAALGRIDAKQLMEEGLRGPAVGKALREHRLQTLTMLLEKR
ncbi:multifunctional CCA tRNA nucleotidyl transferase/2'3'-cyclic phosphodiesterase/2'nucleotidase/phosphatase [Spongiibacter tropicus]|uniref:multifunctional CCA tRNA nucleotidyl transferase/2'3'-cyclic phosphodiesterase/2'nucleotidase/phosphatase n=1 Tax=Spongiibacter tropicus TaxID=454602 RepID=UPI0035BE1807